MKYVPMKLIAAAVAIACLAECGGLSTACAADKEEKKQQQVEAIKADKVSISNYGDSEIRFAQGGAAKDLTPLQLRSSGGRFCRTGTGHI